MRYFEKKFFLSLTKRFFPPKTVYIRQWRFSANVLVFNKCLCEKRGFCEGNNERNVTRSKMDCGQFGRPAVGTCVCVCVEGGRGRQTRFVHVGPCEFEMVRVRRGQGVCKSRVVVKTADGTDERDPWPWPQINAISKRSRVVRRKRRPSGLARPCTPADLSAGLCL